MQSRSRRFQLMVGMVAGLALLGWGGARTATAETLDLSAIFASDCALAGVADGSDLAFLDDQAPAAAPAEPAGKVCKTNAQCGKKEYCAKEVGACKGEGQCKARPATCPMDVVDPVCGCNHKTYNNDCLASKAGVNVDHKGKCEKKGHKTTGTTGS
jgi:hypothetical protein